MQQREVHLVGTMGIGGMRVRLDIGQIVEQHIEDVMAFMLVGANNASTQRHMAGQYRST